MKNRKFVLGFILFLFGLYAISEGIGHIEGGGNIVLNIFNVTYTIVGLMCVLRGFMEMDRTTKPKKEDKPDEDEQDSDMFPNSHSFARSVFEMEAINEYIEKVNEIKELEVEKRDIEVREKGLKLYLGTIPCGTRIDYNELNAVSKWLRGGDVVNVHNDKGERTGAAEVDLRKAAFRDASEVSMSEKLETRKKDKNDD